MVDKFLNSKWMKLWLAISVTAFVGLNLSVDNAIGMILNIPLAFILALFLEYRYRILHKVFETKSKRYVLVSLPIAIYMVIEMVLNFHGQHIARLFMETEKNPLAHEIRRLLPEQFLQVGLFFGSALAGIVALFVAFVMVYTVVSHFKSFSIKIWHGTEQIGRIYFITIMIIFGIFLAVVYSLSPIFWGDTGPHLWGVGIYGFDITENIKTDRQFWLPSASIKKLFYPLVNLPFSLSARALGRILHFIPFSYIYFLQLLHIGLMACNGVLLMRMCKLANFSKIYFLLLYTSSYSFMIFSITLERYILATFCIILFVYANIHLPKIKYITALAATGTLTTNLVAFPLATYDRNMKIWLSNLTKLAGIFIAICVLCGELSTLFDSVKDIIFQLNRYGGASVPTEQKGLQFINFITSIFLKPETALLHWTDSETNITFMSYTLAASISVNWLGIVLIALSVAGFVINRKHQFVRMSFLWAVFTVIIIFVIGWYTKGNETFLGTLYFGWAFFVLVFMFFEKLLEKQRIVKYAVYSLAFIAMTTLNVAGIADLIKFAVQYYPAR